MSKFKRGDVVRRKDGGNMGNGKLSDVVHHTTGKEAWFGNAIIGGCYFTPVSLLEHAHPNPPHKHADLIKAWADGAVIECRFGKYASPKPMINDWKVVPQPNWASDREYRIKQHDTQQDNEKEIEHLRSEILRMSKELEELAGK